MAREAARKVVEAVKEEKRPSDFVTQKSLENVVRYMMATGGSTNSLLHIPALARQMGFDITPETFDAISRASPADQYHLPKSSGYIPWKNLTVQADWVLL